jgi:formylglycine-generating enzyme required for sulfatase activity
MPVNCVSLAQARAACKALGKRLPTEAEWEYAAGNLGLETRYPWGSGPPCDNAVVGVGLGSDPSTSIDCLKKNGDTPGPKPVGSTGDVNALGVHDLAGNLSEWLEDEFQPYSDPTCWGPSATLHLNPVCKKKSLPVVRGGSWQGQAIFAQISLRDANINADAKRYLGFRCAK